MFAFILVLFMLPCFVESCALLSDDAKPKGLEERAIDSEVVLAAYTRTVYKSKNNTTSYSAEFLVFNILKGEDQVVEVYQKRKPSSLETALNRRLVNASNFGDPSKCQSDVNPGETYILFFDVTADGQLTARYDGVYGPAVVYSRDKELALEAIGSSPWSEWSPCSGSCGGGIQQRRRQCNDDKCTNEEGQQRTCNMFPCTGALNALEVANVHRSSLRPSGRPTGYKLLPSGSWRSREEEIIFPRTFPWEFSLLVTVRVKKSSTGGFLLRVLHSGSLQVGLYISDTITLVLSDKDNVRVSFIKSLFDGHWNQIAFSVRRNIVSFYFNCELNGKLPLPGKIRPFGGQPATVIVGSTGPQEIDAFQGDIEQITISGSPDDAEKQCNSTSQPLHYRAGEHNRRQEVKSRPLSSHATLNDQLPLRGDIIDDEDFSFDENGSGYNSNSPDDEYGNDDDDYEEDDGKRLGNEKKHNEKDKIPLKSENSEEDESVEDEDEDEEEEEEEEDDEEDDDGSDNGKIVDENDKIDVDSKINDEYENRVYTDKVEKSDKESKRVIEFKDEKNAEDDKKIIKENPKEKKIELYTTTEKIPDEVVEDVIYRDDYDYNRPDDEIDKDDKVEGSGSENDFELAWSEWSPCSSTCNWGRRTRTSYCTDNGKNLESCTEASSKRSETEACFLALCPMSTTTTTPSTTTTEKTLTFMNKSAVSPFFGFIPYKAKCIIKCLNGGTCHPPYKCRCPPGYFGNMCQYALCKPHCLNGGVCTSPDRCRCKSGYTGKSCHKAVCQQGCKNGGECVAPNKCECRSGFTGNDCGEPLCNPACQNGGVCVKPYFCHCPIGTKGAYCEKLSCKTECLNGGTCINPGKCACVRGYTGYNCDQVYCPGGCLNGGKCSKSGKCVCPYGYSGFHCEVRKPCKFIERKEPYKRGFKQKVATQVKVPCGAWGWKMCTKTKVHYETVYKTFYRTFYECENQNAQFTDYQKLKTG